jgi:hypothetical protein
MGHERRPSRPVLPPPAAAGLESQWPKTVSDVADFNRYPFD